MPPLRGIRKTNKRDYFHSKVKVFYDCIFSPSLTMPIHQSPGQKGFSLITFRNSKEQGNESSNKQNTLPMTLLPKWKHYFLKEWKEKSGRRWLTEVTGLIQRASGQHELYKQAGLNDETKVGEHTPSGKWGLGGIVNKRLPQKDVCVVYSSTNVQQRVGQDGPKHPVTRSYKETEWLYSNDNSLFITPSCSAAQSRATCWQRPGSDGKASSSRLRSFLEKM